MALFRLPVAAPLQFISINIMNSRWLATAALLATCAAVQGFTPAPSNAGLKPERLQAYGKTHYYQLASEPMVGTMVLIHGCGAGARAFFPYDPVLCPECQGFPEYLGQAKQSLARGYTVLALQANDEGSNCWSSSSRNGRIDDRPHVVATVSEFLRNHTLTELPLYFIGYSSGGTMSLKLPSYIHSSEGQRLRIDGLLPVDAAPSGGFNAEGEDGKMRRGLDFPPTLFIVAEPGKSRQRAPAQIEFLRANGVPADLISSFPRIITPTYFSDRIPTVTAPQSQALVAALRQAGAFNAEGYLLMGAWWDVVRPQLPWLQDGLTFVSVVMEMRIALGEHENLGEFTTAGLAWLESAGEADVAALLKEFVPPRPAAVTIDRQQQAWPQAWAPAPAEAWAPAAAPTAVPVPTNGA